MISLAVVDHNGQLSNLLTPLIREHPEFRIGRSYADAWEAMHTSSQAGFDILAVNANLPEDGAWKLLRMIHTAHKIPEPNPAPPVLIVGLQESREEVVRYIEAGAKGYIRQTDSLDELLTTIQYMFRGEAKISPELAQALMARLWELANRINRNPPFRTALSSLTPREDEILQLLEQGLSNHEIAELLSIEVGTVKNHVHNILEKLGVSNRKQAAEQIAEERGYGHRREHQGKFASAD